MEFAESIISYAKEIGAVDKKFDFEKDGHYDRESKSGTMYG